MLSDMRHRTVSGSTLSVLNENKFILSLGVFDLVSQSFVWILKRRDRGFTEGERCWGPQAALGETYSLIKSNVTEVL